MPGGRLTQPERQQIALGLADDLTYAEIARRLDRPTSTVTREVLRNGGPGSYRADLAQRAAARRARRRAATPPAAASPERPGDARALREFEEWFTTLLMQSGLPRTPAGVLMCLYLSNDSGLTAAELVQRLGVSPSSVSKAIAGLETHGLVLRERVAGRRERYVADGDVWFRSLLTAAKTNADLAEASRQGVRLVGADTPAGMRLASMARFMDLVSDSILRAAADARVMLETEAPAAGAGAASA